MKGILVLAHGSREKKTEETLEQIITMVKKTLPEELIEIAFLQFSEKNLAAGLKALLAKGVTKIKVVPYFLFQGVHICQDIPNEIAEFLLDYPKVTVEMGKTLDADPRLAAILVDRIVG